MNISTMDGPSSSSSHHGTEPVSTKTVCVQGLGFVGAANAVAIAMARNASGQPLYEVIGVDLANELGRERVASINDGRFPFPTTDRNIMQATEIAKVTGNLSAVTDSGAFARAHIIVVDIGVDVENKGERPTVRMEPFRTAITAVGDHMQADALVLLESTVPPGTCEKIVAPILKDRLKARGLPTDQFHLAYCYERIMPGDTYLSSIVDMCRVYSGMTPQAADAAKAFLSSYIDTSKRNLFRLPDIRSAETAKILENTYRAVTIALIDEWERFARRIDIDLFEVLEAVRMRPTHSNIRYPGLGVGGYCLTKDPIFGAVSAREIYGFEDLRFPMSTASVQINDATPQVSADALESILSGGLQGKRILILGASYRPDIGDTRQSPSATLGAILTKRGATVEVSDPLAISLEVDALLHKELPDAKGFDAIIIAVAHREYKELDLLTWIGDAHPIIFDANGVLSREKLASLREAGHKIVAIGRGGQV